MDMNMAQIVNPLFPDEKKRQTDDEKNWLTGDEVLQKTGISKTDLIRFIQLGVLPKSMMRTTRVGPDGIRRKSYFSRAIVQHVALLKRLRDQGHCVKEIASKMRRQEKGAMASHRKPLPETPPAAPLSEESPEKATPPEFHFPVNTIAGTTFFVGRDDLRIGWIKVERDDRLSRAIKNEVTDDPSGTVFEIMLRASLKELVFNWQPLFSFIRQFLWKTTPPDTFNRLAPTVSLIPGEREHADGCGPGGGQACFVDSCPIRLADDGGSMQEMRIYGIALAEGSIFVLDEDRWQDLRTESRANAPGRDSRAEADSASRNTAFSVLSARLDDSRSIVDTLLPETYFQLMTRIWDESDHVLASFGGQRARRSGTEVQYIIPQHGDTDPAYDAIRCAVALKDRMRRIEESLKSDGGWFADIRLNIGISSGRDHHHHPPEDLAASMAFMLPGAAADQAFHLSAIALGGAIWITKSAFGHLTAQQMKQITFGIYRDDRLVPSIFARVSDLPHAPDTPTLGREIRSLSVTRIIALLPDK